MTFRLEQLAIGLTGSGGVWMAENIGTSLQIIIGVLTIWSIIKNEKLYHFSRSGRGNPGKSDKENGNENQGREE